MKKINIDSLVIEITRRCNMHCEHCLRGDQQDTDMQLVYLHSLFQKIKYVNCLTITGGEPSLNISGIRCILSVAKLYNVRIGNFFVATNAKEITHDFIRVMIDLYLYCEENEISQVAWSNDEYHDNNPEAIKLLKALSFSNPNYPESNSRSGSVGIIDEGRANENGLGGRILNLYPFEIEEDNITESEIYLNCEGNIINGCDWSYESQEEKERIICSVHNFSLEAVIKYNEKLKRSKL